MAMIRDQKPYEAVAAEALALEESGGSVTKIARAGVVAEVEPPADSALSATAATARDRESPAESVERFFDLIIDELSALRTRAEVDSIERAANLILESESTGGRVHVTGIGKSEHIARYVASLLSSTGTPASCYMTQVFCSFGGLMISSG